MNIFNALRKPGNRLYISLLLCLSLLVAPLVHASEIRPTERIRVKFSETIEKSIARAATALDKTFVNLSFPLCC